MTISCIIPVYKVEHVLSKCIESVLKQTYGDFKIILVNDCSPDGSLSICRRYEAKYPDKITVIDKPKNEGVDKARFTGLEYVLSDSRLSDGAVTFLDSDDWLSKDAFRRLNDEMMESGADVVEMRGHRVFGPVKLPIYSPAPSQIIEQPRLMEEFYISFFGVNILIPGVWAKLYRASLLKRADLQPSGFKMGEDLMFMVRLFPYIGKLSLIDYFGYNYRMGGLTSRYNPTFWEDLKKQYAIKRNELVKHNYTKGFRPLAVELVNIFYTEITQHIYYLNETKPQTCSWIASELKVDDLWKDAKVLEGEKFRSVREGDIDAIYETALQILKARRKRRVLKKMLSFFFK